MTELLVVKMVTWMVSWPKSGVFYNWFLEQVVAFAIVRLSRNGLTFDIEWIRLIVIEDVSVNECVCESLAYGLSVPALAWTVAHNRFIY